MITDKILKGLVPINGVLLIDYWHRLLNEHGINDLQIIMLLAGLASVQSIGFGIPVLRAFELGIIFLSNKLFVPSMLMNLASDKDRKGSEKRFIYCS